MRERQRRPNAGSRLLELIAEQTPLTDEDAAIFAEREDDGDFSTAESENDHPQLNDSENEPNEEVDDFNFTDSSDNTDAEEYQEPVDIGEKELVKSERQLAREKRRAERNKIFTIKQRVEKPKAPRKKRIFTSADILTEKSGRHSERKSALKHKQHLIEQMQEAEARRANYVPPKRKKVVKLTQEQRLEEAKKTELKNLASLNKFVELEEERKYQQRLAMLSRRPKLTEFIRYQSSQYLNKVQPTFSYRTYRPAQYQSTAQIQNLHQNDGKPLVANGNLANIQNPPVISNKTTPNDQSRNNVNPQPTNEPKEEIKNNENEQTHDNDNDNDNKGENDNGGENVHENVQKSEDKMDVDESMNNKPVEKQQNEQENTKNNENENINDNEKHEEKNGSVTVKAEIPGLPPLPPVTPISHVETVKLETSENEKQTGQVQVEKQTQQQTQQQTQVQAEPKEELKTEPKVEPQAPPPPQLLPLYGPQQLKTYNFVSLHEFPVNYNKVAARGIVLGPIASTTTHPPPKRICPFTGKFARFRDPKTGIAYYDLNSYKKIQLVRENKLCWLKELGGIFTSDGITNQRPAKGVPPGFS